MKSVQKLVAIFLLLVTLFWKAEPLSAPTIVKQMDYGIGSENRGFVHKSLQNNRTISDRKSREFTIMEVTAYTAGYESTGKTPNDPSYGITASGVPVEEGVTVACPKSIPFGTKIFIEGVGERVCQDRGGAITEGHVDVYMPDKEQALKFGRQHLRVYIVN